MNKLRLVVPNSLTSLNLLLGCIAIIVAFGDHPMNAGYFIMAATVPDFFDGFFARLLKAQSEFGKQLDSLADMVSFGVAPSVILFRLMFMSITGNDSFSPELPGVFYNIVLYSTFFIALFSALRLARFNITQSSVDFLGLPTPANALLIASLGIYIQDARNEAILSFMLHPLTLFFLIVILSFLLISNIPMFSLKFKEYSIKNNLLKYTFLVICLLLILFTGFPGIGLCILLYILLSVFHNLFTSH